MDVGECLMERPLARRDRCATLIRSASRTLEKEEGKRAGEKGDTVALERRAGLHRLRLNFVTCSFKMEFNFHGCLSRFGLQCHEAINSNSVISKLLRQLSRTVSRRLQQSKSSCEACILLLRGPECGPNFGDGEGATGDITNISEYHYSELVASSAAGMTVCRLCRRAQLVAVRRIRGLPQWSM